MIAKVKAIKLVQGQPITFPERTPIGKTKEHIKQLMNLGKEYGPSVKKFVDKIVKRLQEAPEKPATPGTPGTQKKPGEEDGGVFIRHEDPLKRTQKLIIQINDILPFVRASGLLTKELMKNQTDLASEFKRAKGLVKELGKFMNPRTKNVMLTDESIRLMDSLNTVRQAMNTLMNRIQEALERHYDVLSETDITKEVEEGVEAEEAGI